MNKVDPNKVNLSEKDIEDWLWENPNSVDVEEWVARQLRVPSGIIDLLGVGQYGYPVVVEVKNVGISSDAILQVCRYAQDIRSVLSDARSIAGNYDDFQVKKILVFRGGIDDKYLYESNAVDVELRTFDVEFDLTISSWWVFSRDKSNKDKMMIHELSSDEDFIRCFFNKDNEVDNADLP